MATRKSKKTTGKPKGKFKIELGLTKTLSLTAFIVLAMVWSFILGVFIGRGYNPEDVLPEIARIMPDANKETSASSILRPEDLDFFDQLRSSPAPAPAPVQHQTPAPPAEQIVAAVKPEPVIETPPPPAQPDVPSAPAVATFVYSYQVGSFQTMDKAIEMQHQLMSDGIQASIADAFVDNAPWFRVIVEFESTETGSDRFLKQLENHGITQPLFRGKRPS